MITNKDMAITDQIFNSLRVNSTLLGAGLFIQENRKSKIGFYYFLMRIMPKNPEL
jgi:hypothetical protein